MKNKIVAIFIAFTICFLSSFCGCFVGSSNVVSAAEVNNWESGFYSGGSSVPEQTLIEVYEAFAKNSNLSELGISNDKFALFIYTYSSGMSLIQVCGSDYIARSDYAYVWSAYSDRAVYSSIYTTINDTNLANFQTMHFSLKEVSFSSNSPYDGVFWSTSHNSFITGTVYFGMSTVTSPSTSRKYALLLNYSPPFEPSFNGSYKGLNLDFDPSGFYDWIIDNNKLSSLPSYIVQSKLLSFLQFYKQYGSSYTSFSLYIKDWFSYMNIANQSADNINILKNSIDDLYREYISNYIVTFYPDTKNHFHHRQNIDTNTDDTNTTLITNDPTDTIDISILRDILRGVIAVSNNLTSNFQALFDKIDNVLFTLSLVNNGGSSNLSVLYVYDINDFNDDFETFEENVSSITAVPLSYVQTINNNSLMPENMLTDKQSLTVTIPVINGFTVNSDGTEYVTNTDTYTLNSTDYPWLDIIVKKMKRFASIMLIIGYLIHLRFKIADIVRGE